MNSSAATQHGLDSIEHNFLVRINYSGQNCFGFSPSLFNQNDFLNLKNGTRINYQLLTPQNQTILAVFNVNLENNMAISPMEAPYGSIEFAPTLRFSALHFFMSQILDDLRKRNIRSIEIKNYPSIFFPAQEPILDFIFLRHGFEVSCSELNYHIATQAKEDFKKTLDPSERNRLSKAKKAGFSFHKLDINDFDQVYDLLENSIKKHSVPLSMSRSKLRSSIKHLPGIYALFGIQLNQTLVSSAICVKVTPEIFYLFYIGALPKFQNFSPMVMLYEGIYAYAVDNGYTLLDYGIATDKGNPNPGLIHFKENMGGVPSLKKTYTLQNV